MNINSLYGVNSVGKTGVIQQAVNNNLRDKDYFKKGNNTSPIQRVITTPNVASIYSPWLLLNAYLNKDFLNSLVKKSPEIKEIAKKCGFETEINPKNVSDIVNTHLKSTTAYAMQIANQMNLTPAERKYLEQACVFHDIGKILMPDKILNKPDKLTDDERKIIDLHSQMGYELMKNTGMNKRVLMMIKNHHMPSSNNADTLGQILSVADIYSALREQRCYKTPMTVREAMTILDQKTGEGEVSTEVVDALKASIPNLKTA